MESTVLSSLPQLFNHNTFHTIQITSNISKLSCSVQNSNRHSIQTSAKAMTASPPSGTPSGEMGTPRSPTSPVQSHHSSEAPSLRPQQTQRPSTAGRGFSINSLLCPADNAAASGHSGSSPPNGLNASPEGQDTDRDRDPNANSSASASANGASVAANQSITDVLARMAGPQSLEQLLSRAWLLAAAQQTQTQGQPAAGQNLPNGQIHTKEPGSAGDAISRSQLDSQQGEHLIEIYMLYL